MICALCLLLLLSLTGLAAVGSKLKRTEHDLSAARRNEAHAYSRAAIAESRLTRAQTRCTCGKARSL